MIRLPESFLVSMQALLESAGLRDRWPAFLQAYEEPPLAGLRRNALKWPDQAAWLETVESVLRAEDLLAGTDRLEAVSWSSDGFYVLAGAQPGRSFAWENGWYYIQEPSAMLPAEVLGSRQGERILDLCAAPGGKSGRIAADMSGQGWLLANDVSASRGRILVRNLEQLGVRNATVTAAEPAVLARMWPAAFDRVLVDAPCSGEGMFRRDPKAVSSWEAYGPASMLDVQAGILDAAVELLRPGGELVYSTCTFNTAENEEQIAALLRRRPDVELLQIRGRVPDSSQLYPGILAAGLSEAQAACMARIWPWDAAGEGHFCALLRRNGDRPGGTDQAAVPSHAGLPAGLEEQVRLFWARMLTAEALRRVWPPEARLRGEHQFVHLLPASSLDTSGLHVLMEGVNLGQWRETRGGLVYHPSHTALTSLKTEDLAGCLRLDGDDERIRRFRRGETIELTAAEADRTFPDLANLAVTAGDWPLGWARRDRGRRQLKNRTPAGWLNRSN